MKRTVLAALGFFAIANVHAVDISIPGSTIVGGQLSGANFVVATVGTVPLTNNHPAAEPPSAAIDNVLGSKYLNFAETNTGYVVSPSVGLSNVTGIRFTTGNDAPERDPASYQLLGTNAGLAGSAASLIFANYTAISSGALALPAARGSVDPVGATINVPFANAGNYTTYMLIFPTVKDGAAANSMQIGEAVLTGTVIPEPGVAAFGLLGALALLRRRK